MASDIRQRSPLALLVFILALDPLYRRLDGFMELRGVVVQSVAGRFELRKVGYADDTAALNAAVSSAYPTNFVLGTADIPFLLKDLDTFAKASGLRIKQTRQG